MEATFSIYSIICFISGVLLSSFAFILMKKFRDISSKILGIIMLLIAIYNIGYGFELASSNIEVMYKMLKLEYFGIAFLPGMWMLFAYSYKKNNIPGGIILFFFIISLTTLVLVITNEYHGLYYSKLEYKRVKNISIAVIDGGIWYYVHMLYFNFSIVVGNILFLKTFNRTNKTFKKHGIILIIGSFFPWFAYMLYLTGYTPYGIDLTPYGLVITSIIFILGILKYRVIEVLPVARDIVFESIREGVIVIDKFEQIADFNKSAEIMIKELNYKSIGVGIRDVLYGYGNIFEKLSENGIAVLSIDDEFDQNRYLEFRIDKIENGAGKEIGSALLVQDVTENIKMIQELEKIATTDELTGVHNRRHLMELSVREGMLAKRYKKDMAVAVIDIDFFKDINDTLGHIEGDRVLEKSAATIRNRLRRTDIFGRYGGDEFIITFPETDADIAYQISEEIRREINEEMKIGLSIGVCGNEKGEIIFRDMLKLADEALYQSKQGGRNRTTIYGGKI